MTVQAPSSASPGVRERLRALLGHPRFERFIIAVIIVNAITLGLETSPTMMSYLGPGLIAIDKLCLIIFVIELVAKLYVYGLRFWRDPWNVFDFAIVAVALVPASGELAVLRSLRILRALRLISAVPSIRRVVASLLSAIPSMGSIIVLLLLINYVFSVMATKLYGQDFPTEFGTLGASFFTFFQIMTLEGWAGSIVRPVMEKHPWAWAFFVPYIVVTTFAVLNLFIGIVVDAMQNQADETRERVIEVTQSEYQSLMTELTHVRTELRLMRSGAELPPLPRDDARDR